MLNALSKNKLRKRLNISIKKREFDRVDMISEYERYTGNSLKHLGGKYQGLCPFHEEDTPSFTIFPDTDSYFCFGCQISGKGNWLLKLLKEKYGC